MPALTLTGTWSATLSGNTYVIASGQNIPAGSWAVACVVDGAVPIGDSVGNLWLRGGVSSEELTGGAGGVMLGASHCVLTQDLNVGDTLFIANGGGRPPVAIRMYYGTGMTNGLALEAVAGANVPSSIVGPSLIQITTDHTTGHGPLIVGAVASAYPNTAVTPHLTYVPDDAGTWNALVGLLSDVVRNEGTSSPWHALHTLAGRGDYAQYFDLSGGLTAIGPAVPDPNCITAALVLAYRGIDEPVPRSALPVYVAALGTAVAPGGGVVPPLTLPAIPARDRLIVVQWGNRVDGAGLPVIPFLSTGALFTLDCPGSEDAGPAGKVEVWSYYAGSAIAAGVTLTLDSAQAIVLQVRAVASGGPSPDPSTGGPSHFFPDFSYFGGSAAAGGHLKQSISPTNVADGFAGLSPNRTHVLLIGAAVVGNLPLGNTLTVTDPGGAFAWNLLTPSILDLGGFQNALAVGWAVTTPPVLPAIDYECNFTLSDGSVETLDVARLIVAYYGAPAGSTAGVWCLHSPYGSYQVADGHGGAVTYQRSDFAVPPFSMTSTGPLGTEPRMAYLDLPHLPMWLVFAREDGIYYAISHDDGETWGAPVSVLPNGKHPTLSVDPASGDLIIAGYVETNVGAATGELHGVYRAAGGVAFSAPFSFVDSASVPIAVSDDSFHLSPAGDSARRWVLACRLASAPTVVSAFFSCDEGRSWTLVT